MTDRRTQLVAVNCCWAFMVLFGFGWVVLAGFLPPPAPTASALSIAHRFRGNVTGIRVGMIVSIFSGALLLPWGGAVCAQMRRIEGRHAALTWAWIAAQGCIVIEFIYPCAFWAVAAFRTGDPSRVQNFNDLAWLPFLGIVSTGMFQMVALAYLALKDTRSEPIYPRWFGYFQGWCAVGILPAMGIYAFHTGPLAWNGFLAFYVAITVGFVWFVVTTVMTARAIRHEAENPDPVLDAAEVARRFGALEAELAALKAERVGVPHG